MSRRPSLPSASSASKSFCRCTQPRKLVKKAIPASRCDSSPQSVGQVARGRFDAGQMSGKRSQIL